MRINILLGTEDYRSGYLNINPLADPNDNRAIRSNIDQLDMYADNNECEEILALDVLDFVPNQEKDRVFTHWLSKLSHGGIMKIGGLDLGEVSRAFARREIDLSTANQLLYGTKVPRTGAATVEMMGDVIVNKGLKVLSKKIENFMYVIEVERP